MYAPLCMPHYVCPIMYAIMISEGQHLKYYL